MQIQAFGHSDVGRERQHNEDCFLNDPELGLFVVCDGMGGHAAGEVASAHTVRTIHRIVSEQRALLDDVHAGRAELDVFVPIVRHAIELACTEIHQLGLADKAKRGMGTTCTAFMVANGKGLLAHVGDSRLYLVRRGHLTQLSQDHTYVAEALRQGLIRPEEAEKSPYGNVVTRAVGPQSNVLVDVMVFGLAPGDTYLLCSDGLHQYTNDAAELVRVLDVPSTEAAARTLIDLANQRGGSDNITAIVVRAHYSPQQSSKRMLDVVTDIDALSHIELLREMNMAEVVKLCQAFHSVSFDAGAFILREGELSETFFVLVEGSAEVYRGNQRLAVLPKGSHFGEMAILSLRPRSATVRATTKVRALVTDRTSLYGFLQQDPLIAAKFFWKIAQTLSLRLDEAYVQATTGAAPEPNGRETMRFGAYPTPYPVPKTQR